MSSPNNTAEKILRAAFKYVDIENEGKTDVSQFRRMLGRFGLTESSTADFADAFDWLSHQGDPRISHSQAVGRIMKLFNEVQNEEADRLDRTSKSRDQHRDRT